MTLAKRMTAAFLTVCLLSAAVHGFSADAAGSRVTFNEQGIALVKGKPFFPLGVFTYELNSEVLAELHEVQCNTILNGFAPNQLDLIEQHGLMAVCGTTTDWLQAAQHHPALLAWYLDDE